MGKRAREAARAAVGAVPSLFVVCGAAHAAVPQQINYQGYLTNAASQPVTAANYLKDVNASGTLTVANKGIANTQITKALPAP